MKLLIYSHCAMIIEVEFESWNGFCSIVIHNLAGLVLILEGMKQISGSENTSILISDIRSVFQRLSRYIPFSHSI